MEDDGIAWIASMGDTATPSDPTDPSEWVDRFGDILYRYARLRVAENQVAEDLVQETFLAALQARERFGGRSTAQTWLIGILRNKIMDHLRRRSASTSGDVRDPESERFFDVDRYWRREPGNWPNDPRTILERKEFWLAFRDCVDRLPSRLADAYILREVEGLPPARICEVLGISPANLAVRLHRARLFLRECLEIHWFSDGQT